MDNRPWYMLHGKTYLVMLLALVPLGVLVGGAIDVWRRSHIGLVPEQWIMPVRFMAIGILLFGLCALIVSAMVSERWLRLIEKQKNPEPERKEI